MTSGFGDIVWLPFPRTPIHGNTSCLLGLFLRGTGILKLGLAFALQLLSLPVVPVQPAFAIHITSMAPTDIQGRFVSYVLCAFLVLTTPVKFTCVEHTPCQH